MKIMIFLVARLVEFLQCLLVKIMRVLSLASNASDWSMISFTPFSSDQMIRNLSMKIGEVDSGSARLLCDSQRQSLG